MFEKKSEKTTTKEYILDVLSNSYKANPLKLTSGENIAKELNISRAAVSKAIGSLKAEGYPIFSKTGEGYRLQSDVCTKLNSKSLSKYLNELLPQLPIDNECFNIISSTNTYAKAVASRITPPYIIAASTQTGGRGRLGRSFFSPDNSGIYFTIILKPNLTIFQVSFITLLAAIATQKVMQSYCTEKIKIKWPNDILCKGKKLCGILTECSATGENNALEYAIIGIGINLLGEKDDIPDELKDVMTTAQMSGAYKIDKNLIVAQITKEFLYLYDNENFVNNKKNIIKKYKENLCFLNKDINVISSNNTYVAKLVDVDDDGRLIVQKDGENISVCSGEISIRPY